MVVPQAAIPVANALFPVPAVDALQVVPVEASSLITMDVGTPGVRVLLIKSLRAERETRPSGVTGQAQQEINCSSGEKVYTFTQMLPFVTAAPLTTALFTTGTLPAVFVEMIYRKHPAVVVLFV